jgi:hypothetical protein
MNPLNQVLGPTKSSQVTVLILAGEEWLLKMSAVRNLAVVEVAPVL